MTRCLPWRGKQAQLDPRDHRSARPHALGTESRSSPWRSAANPLHQRPMRLAFNNAGWTHVEQQFRTTYEGRLRPDPLLQNAGGRREGRWLISQMQPGSRTRTEKIRSVVESQRNCAPHSVELSSPVHKSILSVRCVALHLVLASALATHYDAGRDANASFGALYRLPIVPHPDRVFNRVPISKRRVERRGKRREIWRRGERQRRDERGEEVCSPAPLPSSRAAGLGQSWRTVPIAGAWERERRTKCLAKPFSRTCPATFLFSLTGS